MTPDLSRFRCRRCGACCRIPGGLVRLREGESAALAAARMPKLFSRDATEVRNAFLRGILGPSVRLGVNVTMMLLGCLETPALFAMVGGMIALGLRA